MFLKVFIQIPPVNRILIQMRFQKPILENRPALSVQLAGYTFSSSSISSIWIFFILLISKPSDYRLHRPSGAPLIRGEGSGVSLMVEIFYLFILTIRFS